MDDGELIRRFRAGDREAWADLYRRYRDRVYTLCRSVLRTDEAADAAHDTFLRAYQHLGELRDPAALRPWLLRIAWTESVRRSKKRARSIPTADFSVTSASPEAGPDETAHQRELQQLVWAAAAGLPDEDRLVLELHVHQGLQGHELAEAIGVSPGYARKLVQRVRARTERSLGAFLVATRGGRQCATLQQLLVGWDGRFSPLLRKRVARHVDDCTVCGADRATLANPLALLAATPMIPAPAWIGDQLTTAAIRAGSRAASATVSGPYRAARLANRSRRLSLGAASGVAAASLLAVALWPSKPEPAEPFTVVAAGDHRDLDIAVDGDGNTYVAWFDVGADPDRALVRRQTGDGWSEAMNLADGFTNPGPAQLVETPDGRVCAYLHGFADSYGLYERCWEDDAWSDPEQVADRGSDLAGITTTFAPTFAPDGSLHVAWETPPSEVGYGDQVLSAPGTNGYLQSIADSEGRLHVLWWNGTTGNIDHRWSDDEGGTWSEPEAIDDNFNWQTAADGNKGIHVVSVTGDELVHRRWTVDEGWSEPVDVSGDEANSLTYPGLTGLGDGGSAVAWIRDGTLVVSKQIDEGDLAAPVTVPEATEHTVQTQLAADGDTLHIAWLTNQGEIVHYSLP